MSATAVNPADPAKAVQPLPASFFHPALELFREPQPGGLGDARFPHYWRLDVPGYHHTEEIARSGQASVTIDRLGYGDSDRPNGFGLCLGGEADITAQIIEHLRGGGPSTGLGFGPAGQPHLAEENVADLLGAADIDRLARDLLDFGLDPRGGLREIA